MSCSPILSIRTLNPLHRKREDRRWVVRYGEGVKAGMGVGSAWR